MATNTLADKLMKIIDGLIGTSTSIPIIGLSGPQGSGKSTALEHVLKHSSFRIAGLGLDDFYLPKSGRMILSETISPLFETRGPPGTHDINLLQTTLDELLGATPETVSPIPIFDKPSDERLVSEKWGRFQGRPEAIILEGWMVGATPSPDFVTAPPMNETEYQDTNKAWRREQYEQLSRSYADTWDRIDHFVHIVGPGFDAVLNWRMQQEATNLNLSLSSIPHARRQWVAAFVQYFERLTISMQNGYKRPGIILPIDADRRYIGA